MTALQKTMEGLNRIVWGVPALILILAVGVALSIGTRFVQVRRFGYAMSTIWRRLFSKKQSETSGVSPFQAVCTALAATVGIGNIAGVAGAISLGGPGAVFWMLLSAVLGMVIKYAEVVLAVRYRKGHKGAYYGGPMYYIRDGLGSRWKPLAVAFCLFGILAAAGVGNSAQVSALVAAMNSALNAFQIPENPGRNLAVGLAIGILATVTLLGGAKRIGAVTELLVPVMSVGYLLLAGGALIVFRQRIPAAVGSILAGAFQPGAVTGGLVGSCFTAMRIGVARGVFSNEAGMGTASIAHAGADTDYPAEQGLYGIFEVFVDTVLICTMTALVILVSGVPVPYGRESGAELTVLAFVTAYGKWVTVFTALAMASFAGATVLGWGLYGLRCAEFLLGPKVEKPFALAHGAVCVLGAVLSADLVWQASELFNGLMAIPNLIAMALLSPEVFRLTRAYFTKEKISTGTRRKDTVGERGSYENFNQCQPVPALSYAEVPSSGTGGREKGKKDLSSEHRSAGHCHAAGLF